MEDLIENLNRITCHEPIFIFNTEGFGGNMDFCDNFNIFVY